MPTYRNNTSTRKPLENKVVEPSGEIVSLVYYPEDVVQLLKISDKPFYNPIIYSEVITENGVVKVPEKGNLGEWITKYAIHFYVENGEVEIYYNDPTNKPPLKLYSESRWNLRLFSRVVDKLFVRSLTKAFKLWVIVEKI